MRKSRGIKRRSRYVIAALEPRMLLSGNVFSGYEYPVSAPSSATLQQPLQDEIVTADFNHDGLDDVAVLGEDGNIGVLINRGDGTFGAVNTYRAGVEFGALNIALDTADVNGDHLPDLIATTSTTLVVLLNLGDGVFGPATVCSTGYFTALTAFDLNGDGYPDLIAAGKVTKSGGLTVLTNQGNGTFGNPASFGSVAGSSTVYPTSISVADLNNDGNPDVVVGGENGGNSTGLAAIFLDSGGGQFTPATVTQAGTGSLGWATVTAVDLNGDHYADLVATSKGGSNINRSLYPVWVSRGNGDGTFQTPVGYDAFPSASGNDTMDAVAVDLNGDGAPEIVAAGGGFGMVGVLTNSGTGTFTQTAVYGVNEYAGPLVVGNFNGDGKPDLAVADMTTGTVSVLLNRGDGTFGPTVYDPIPGATNGLDALPAVADINGDHVPDLIDMINPIGGTSALVVHINDGQGHFGPGVSYPASAYSDGPTVVDLNGDGYNDILADSYGGVLNVYLNRGDGTFSAPVSYTTGQVGATLVSDLNGDGRPDIVLQNSSGFNLTVMLNQGNGTFGAPRSITASQTLRSVIDLDGDGHPDLVLAGNNSTGQLVVAYGNGDGTFGPMTAIATTFSVSTAVAADVNGDGNPDLVVGGSSGASAVLGILTGNGHRGFTQTQTISVANPSLDYVQVADANGDGFADLITNLKPGVFLNDGLGHFTPITNALTGVPNTLFAAAVPFSTGVSAQIYGVFNFSTNGESNTFATMNYMPGSGYSAPSLYDIGLLPLQVIVADLNGDGRPDLVVGDIGAQGSNSGGVSVYLNQQTEVVPFATVSQGVLLVSSTGTQGVVTISQAAGLYTVSSAAAGLSYSFPISGITSIRVSNLTGMTVNIASSLPVPLTYVGSSTVGVLNIAAGAVVTLAGDPGVPYYGPNINDNGTLIFAAGTPGGGVNTLHVSSLNLSQAATVSLANPAAAVDRTLVVTNTLNIASGAMLDIGGNAIDSRYGSVVQSLVQSGYDLPGGGDWSGPGITSFTAATDSARLTAVATINNVQGGKNVFTSSRLFDGYFPGNSDVLIKTTYFGDANLDGKVDGSDYSLIDSGYAAKGTLTGWYNGDFNYDGVIDGSDYALIDNAFNNQRAAIPSALVAASAEFVSSKTGGAIKKTARPAAVYVLYSTNPPVAVFNNGFAGSGPIEDAVDRLKIRKSKGA